VRSVSNRANSRPRVVLGGAPLKRVRWPAVDRCVDAAEFAARETRRAVLALRFGAGALIAFGVAEAIALGVGSAEWAVRVGWAAVALLTANAMRHRSSRRPALLLFAALSPILFAALVGLRGGADGVAFASFVATPIVAANVTALGGLTLLHHAGHRGTNLVEWGIALVSSGVLATYAAWMHRQIVRTEELARAARVEALQAVAAERLARARAEQNALLAQLAAGLAHEVNNPLAIIQLNAHLLEDELMLSPGSAPAVGEMLTEICAASRRVSQVVMQLHAVAPASPSDRCCDLRAAVAKIGTSSPDRLTVRDNLPVALPPVRASSRQLESVLQHLVFMALPVDGSSPVEVRFDARVQGERVCLSVEDDGPELRRASCAESDDGDTLVRGVHSGLGLALIRTSLRAWGGELRLGAREGGGAWFALEFAAAGSDEARAPS